MDASPFYALLRFEEASLALRVALRLNLVDRLGGQWYSHGQLRELCEFTEQAAHTFFALLAVMRVLERDDQRYRATPRAQECLVDAAPTSRRPYLAMASGDEVDQLVMLLQGRTPPTATPLYGSEGDGETLMDVDDVAAEIAWGLASRARNFAEPLAEVLAKYAAEARVLADVGAGSPYVAAACLRRLPRLERAILVDRPNGMRFAREMALRDLPDAGPLEFHEHDFFAAVPPADLYIVSNTAHDWRREEYGRLLRNIRASMSPAAVVCLHEPLLRLSWRDEREWIDALWMACYALTLFKLTLGQGTCYTLEQHDAVMAEEGFDRLGPPQSTCDGCTANFYG